MKITFNGKEYPTLDEMPPDVRQAYEALTNAFADNDRNGMPDIFEGKGNAQVVNLGNVFTGQTGFSKIFFEGKEYSSPDELPPDARAKYEQAMGTLSADANQNGIPDLLEQGGAPVVKVSRQFSFGNQPPTSVTSAPTASGLSDTRMFLLGIAIVILLLLIAALLSLIFVAPMLRP